MGNISDNPDLRRTPTTATSAKGNVYDTTRYKNPNKGAAVTDNVRQQARKGAAALRDEADLLVEDPVADDFVTDNPLGLGPDFNAFYDEGDDTPERDLAPGEKGWYGNYANSLAPQANSLPQLAATVDAVALGIDVKDEIAKALGGYHQRQGDYYASAAEALGLIYALDNTSPRVWVLTDAGQEFSVADAEQRVRLLEDGLVENHWINLYAEGEEETLKQGFRADGYSGQTLQRRVDCVRNWSNFLFTLSTPEKIDLIGGARQTVLDWGRDNAERIEQTHTDRKAGRSRRGGRRGGSQQIEVKRRNCPSCYLPLAGAQTECVCGENVSV